MKRYFIHSSEVVDFILNCTTISKRGEIFIPKMKLFTIKELANKVSKKHKIIGLRQGEKLQEKLLSLEEKSIAIEKSNMWVIRPFK